MESKPSDILKPYDNVLTIKTKAGLVPVYKMIEKYLFIEDKEGRKIPFILNRDQCDAYKEMCIQRMSGRPIRLNILKARQLGFSTFIAGLIFVQTIFVAGKKAAIVADIAEHASNLFDKYNFFYNNLPDGLKIPRVKSNAKEMVVEYPSGQRSSIRIMVQGESAGRSGTYQMLHLSECAFWKDLQKTLTSLLQTVSATNLDSMVFLETTANGINDYKLRWDNDYSGNSSYKPMFYAWQDVYRDEYIEEYDKPEFLIKEQEKYNLDEAQCMWRYRKWLEFNCDLDMLRQEFPSSPIEAFVTSGNAVFNSELIAMRKAELMHNKPLKRGFFSYTRVFNADGMITISNIKWIDSSNGAIKMYEDYVDGHPYVINNDPAQGGEDYFATQVFNNYTGHQVAVYHRNKCDPDDCAFQMYCLAKYYGDAMVSGETNTTAYILQMIHKCGYRFIYQDQDIEELGTRYFNKLGYKTKTNNRNQMIDMFKMAFRDDPKIINDYDTICEMESFQIVKHQNGTEKIEATSGSHDDLVMACCGFYLCRNLQTSIPKEKSHFKKNSIEELEYIIEERRRNNTNERNVYNIEW